MAQVGYHYIENYSNIGKIGISYDAIAEMVKVAIADTEKTRISKNPHCEVRNNILNVNVFVKVDYGANVNKVTSTIQEKVLTALTNMCEINNAKVNVKIEGILVK